MFKRIKDLVEMSRIVDQISKRIEKNTRMIDELDKTVSGFREQMKGFVKDSDSMAIKQSKLVERFAKDTSEIGQIKDEFKKSIYEISVFRKDVYSDLLKRFEETVSAEIEDKTKELQTGSAHYKKLSTEISKIGERTVETQEVLDKLLRVGKRIKEGDFELGKFANQMRRLEGEKMALLRKIDTLERLVSRLRRKI